MRGWMLNVLNDASYTHHWLCFESGIFIKERPVTCICKLFVLHQHIFQY